MPVEIVVPDLGESILEATVLVWHKQAGDRVTAGDVVVELETDKVNLDVAAPQDGVLARIERQEGEDVQVGDVLARLEAATPGEKAPRPSESEPAREEPQAQKPRAPEQKEEASRPPGEARSDLAKDMPSEAAEGEAPEPAGTTVRATPVARRLAEEQGIDLARLSGSGHGGRITRDDVESYLSAETQPDQPRAEQPPGREQPRRVEPSLAAAGDDRRDHREERIRMSRRRRTIAERLVEAQHTAAMLTTFNDVDMSGVMALRRRHKAVFQERQGVKLGIASFFVKAAIGALKAFPQLNAEIQGDEIVLKRYYDIGVAIGAAEGLVVPVLRDADRMSFAEIEQAIKTFAQKAEDGTLSLEDLRGGTFTITNGGVFGSLLSTPILNPPQVGILGLHRIEERPVVVDGEIAIRPMMYLALTYDHRIVDGREAVQFLVRIKQLIEDPEILLLEG